MSCCSRAVTVSGFLAAWLMGCSSGYVPLGKDGQAAAGATGAAPACSGASGCTGQEVWAKRFGDWHTQGARAITTDAEHNVIVTGNVDWAVDFGGGALEGGPNDMVLAKLDAAGAHVWSRRFGPAEPLALATDSNGRVLVVGDFNQTTDWGDGPRTASTTDAFIAVYDASGALVWSHQFGGAGGEVVASVAADATGNVFLGGVYWHGPGVDLGGGPLACAATEEGRQAAFVAKLDADGNHVWSKCFEEAAVTSVSVNASGEVVIAGSVGAAQVSAAAVDFGGGPQPVTATGSNLFVARFDAAGGHLWSATYPAECKAPAVATDASGNLLLSGRFAGGTFDLGGAPRESTGDGDAPFIAKLAPDGAHLWSHMFDEMRGQSVASIADLAGNLLVAGTFGSPPSVDFGGGELVMPAEAGACVAKFDPSGQHVWSKVLAGDGRSGAAGIAVDSSGNVLVAGAFRDSLLVDTTELMSAGDDDIFVAKLWP